MSAGALLWAMHQTVGCSLDKLVLMFVADWADQDGEWYFNISKLSKAVEEEEDFIASALWRLHECGALYLRASSVLLAYEETGFLGVPHKGHNRAPIAVEKRSRIFARDNHACTYCGSTERLSIDHIVPISREGTDEDDNLTTACRACNSQKGAKTRDEYLAWLGARDAAIADVFS